jgi:hypothetical protein
VLPVQGQALVQWYFEFACRGVSCYFVFLRFAR